MLQQTVMVTSAVDHICHSRRQEAVRPATGSTTSLGMDHGTVLHHQGNPRSVAMTVHHPATRKRRILLMDLPLTTVPQVSVIFAGRLSTQRSAQIACAGSLAQDIGMNTIAVKRVGPTIIGNSRRKKDIGIKVKTAIKIRRTTGTRKKEGLKTSVEVQAVVVTLVGKAANGQRRLCRYCCAR